MTKTKKQKSLITDKYKRLFIAAVLGWVVYIMGSISDNVLSGLFLGEKALAAVEVVMPFYSFIAFISYIFSPGAGIKFSHYIGKGDHKKAHQTFGLGFAATMSLGLLTALAMILFKNQFLGAFGLSEEVFNYASDYYKWFIGVAIIYPIYMFTYRFACEDGDVRLPLFADIGEMIANIVFSLVFVQILGVEGLGLGTFLSIATSTIIVSFHYFKKSNSVKFGFKFSLSELGDMVKLSLGGSSTCLFVAIVDLVLNFFIAREFGDSYLASYTIVNFVINLSEFFTCVTGSMSGLVAMSDGAKNSDDVKIIVNVARKRIINVCIICTALVCGFCWLLPQVYGITPQSEVYRASWLSALIIGSSLIFYGVAYVLCEYNTCLGDPKSSIIETSFASLIFPIGLTIGCAYLFKALFSNGYLGMIVGFALTPIISFIIVVIYQIKKNKKFTLYIFPDYGDKQFSVDLNLSEQNIVDARNEIETKLKELNVEQKTIMNTLVVVEDLLLIIFYENKDRDVLDRITLCVGDKQIRVLNKDNGKIFRIADKADKDKFLFFNVVPKKKSFQNSLAMSFNTASLIVNRHKEATN